MSNRCVVALLALLSVALGRQAAANCPNGSIAQTVDPGDDLTLILEGATPPCTITVNPGVYEGHPTESWPTDSRFRIGGGLVVRSSSGPAVTTLRAPGTTGPPWISPAVHLTQPADAQPATTFEGFTVEGGVFVEWDVVMRNLVTADVHLQAGSGFNLRSFDRPVVDSCHIVGGIDLYRGRDGLIMNNVVDGAIQLHGGDRNVLVGNAVSGGIRLSSVALGAHSIERSRANRIERNTITGFSGTGIDAGEPTGVPLMYIVQNRVQSSAYHPVTKPVPNPESGHGITADSAYVFGNEVSGLPEAGVKIGPGFSGFDLSGPVILPSTAFLEANRVFANKARGLWVTGPITQDVVLHHNAVFFNTENAQVDVQGAIRVGLAYNHLSGAEGETLAGPNTRGVKIEAAGDTASGAVRAYENTVTDVDNRALVAGTTTDTVFFRNRFLNGSNDPADAPGRRGLTYSYWPADVRWDAHRFLGGNHWSDHSDATQDPDPFHPYRGFLYDDVHGNDGSSPYVDRFPYASASLATAFAPYSVDATQLEPSAGQVLAAGVTKTIRWQARGCVGMNLHLSDDATSTPIVEGYPNVGYYMWTVPVASFGNGWRIRYECLDANGVPVGVEATGPLFTLAGPDLVLFSPGRDAGFNGGDTIRVAWRKSAAVTGVDVFIKADSEPETQVAANVTGTFVDVTLPASITSSNRVTVRIVDPLDLGRQDSVDGFFSVRGPNAVFTTDLAGRTLVIGSIQRLEWVAHRGTRKPVDLDLYQNGVLVESIVTGLIDVGHYDWLVPEWWSANSTVLATFRGIDPTVAETGPFKVAYSTVPGSAVARYRLYSPVTLEHHFTTDANEYAVLGASGVWLDEGTASKMHNGPAAIGGVDAVPYYRLYDFISRWHHWTTDRNEYFTLRNNTGRYVGEGIDGYIFPSQVSGTIPWYRLTYPPVPGLHHWTADTNERDTLVKERGWVEEQREYVLP